jgi:F-type H+-transporting ATPase subunit delta
MSSLTTLARPYARAAFELADQAGELGAWSDMLGLASALAENEAVAAVLSNPLVDAKSSVGLLTDAAGERFSNRFSGFLGVLADNQRLPLLPEVARLFERLREEAEQRLSVRVVSAAAMDESQAERMRDALKRRFGKEVTLESVIDAHVLGGAVIYAGDEVIDGSLRGRLNRLQQSLAA